MKPSISALLIQYCTITLAIFSLSFSSAQAASNDETKFYRVPTQYIAALGDPGATSGGGAQTWGLWRVDPGPRGVWLKNYDQLEESGGITPAKWQFDPGEWWVDENGLLMEKPDFPLPPGKYVVTGDRETISVLTIHPADERWREALGTRLRCDAL